MSSMLLAVVGSSSISNTRIDGSPKSGRDVKRGALTIVVSPRS
jgi:hypothetical protein